MVRLSQIGTLAVLLLALTAVDAKKKRKHGYKADTTVTHRVRLAGWILALLFLGSQ